MGSSCRVNMRTSLAFFTVLAGSCLALNIDHATGRQTAVTTTEAPVTTTAAPVTTTTAAPVGMIDLAGAAITALFVTAAVSLVGPLVNADSVSSSRTSEAEEYFQAGQQQWDQAYYQ